MQIYRFRVLVEEQDDFLRDIEIMPSQSFKELHDILLQSVDIKGNELASFFICDQLWNKKREITLIDMGVPDDDAEQEDYDDNEAKPKEKRIPVMVMEDVKIKEVIDDPHQRIIYEYDFLNPRIFYIELMKITDSDSKKKYPVCVKKEGILAKPIDNKFLHFQDDIDEEAMLDELDEMIKEGDMNEDIDDSFIIEEPEW